MSLLQIFMEKTFADDTKGRNSQKAFSLESIPLYSVRVIAIIH